MDKVIRINGVDQSLPPEPIVFEDFVRGLNQTLGAERRVISSIRVNGKELSESDEAGINSMTLDQIGQIEVETASPADLAYQTLSTLEAYLEKLIMSIERSAESYRAKNLVAGDAYFAKAIDGLDLFVQTIGGVKLALRIGLNTRLALAEAELISVMNDLLDAKRQNNYIFMADLLDKELAANLVEWKTQIFPLIRTIKSS